MKGKLKEMFSVNNALNISYLWFYVRLMVEDQSDRKPAAATSWTTLSNQQQIIFYMYHPTARQNRLYHNLCYTSCGALAIMRNTSKWVYHMGFHKMYM